MSETALEENETTTQPVEVQLPEFFLIPGNLAQGLLQYLAEQPYKDVVFLADGLRSLQVYEAPKPNRAARRTKS